MRRSTLLCLVCGMATPRPMPVEPSSSRLRMALTTSSRSPPRNCPAARRLSTISRMTPSLVVAARAGMIASRTTKSDMRMPAPPSLFGGLFEAGRAGDLAGRRGPAMVLNLFLVAPQLPFDLVENEIDRSKHVVMALLGDEVVLVLR